MAEEGKRECERNAQEAGLISLGCPGSKLAVALVGTTPTEFSDVSCIH